MVSSKRQPSAALLLEMNQYSLYISLGGPQSRSKRVRKISPLPGFDPRTVQAVASCYTSCNILANTETDSS